VAHAVLDASALVALIMRERGHETVRKVVGAGCVVPSTNMIEAVNLIRLKGYNRSAEDVVGDLVELGIEIEPVAADDVLEAVWQLRNAQAVAVKQPGFGSLGLGDATCLAVAKRLELPVIVSDGTWEVLDSGVDVLPFR
jgi:PIN domain nuclease of toxin-antitoxin system